MSSPASLFSGAGEAMPMLVAREGIRDNIEALENITILERTGSVFSLMGSLFVMVTFLTSHAFRKPINQLVFYASFGNLMTNVGTLMSRSFVNDPTGPGCQLQGFLIQMFMPADSLWTLAMAINVYLTFYHKFDAAKLRKMELIYLSVNFCVPFVPAFTYIFISDSNGNRVYGDATLWCWVTPEWSIWRIITFYAPVWLVIVTTMSIYLRAGRTIYHMRMELYKLSGPSRSGVDTDPFSSKTTEVHVTTEVVDTVDGIVPTALTTDRHLPNPSTQAGHEGAGAYSITITAEEGVAHAQAPEASTTIGNMTIGNIQAGPQQTRIQRRRNIEVSNATWSYTKCAILFFSAMCITWVPSSANRVYSVLNGGESLLGLEYASSFVLPLQGLWNCVIYIVTSWTGCKNYFRELGLAPQRKNTNDVPLRSDYGRRDTNKRYETESMTELQNSRPSSNS